MPLRVYGCLTCSNRLAIPVSEDVPLPMESHGIGYGYMVYRTELHWDYTDAKLSFESIGDRAQIYVNDTFAGTVYVNTPPYEVTISAKSGDCLTVVAENMGRTNFGPKMMRKKGIVGRCLLDGKIHFGWQAWPLTMENLAEIPFDSEGAKNGLQPLGERLSIGSLSIVTAPQIPFSVPTASAKGLRC